MSHTFEDWNRENVFVEVHVSVQGVPASSKYERGPTQQIESREVHDLELVVRVRLDDLIKERL